MSLGLVNPNIRGQKKSSSIKQQPAPALLSHKKEGTTRATPPKVVSQLIGSAIPETIQTEISRDSRSKKNTWKITFKIKSKTLQKLACIPSTKRH